MAGIKGRRWGPDVYVDDAIDDYAIPYKGPGGVLLWLSPGAADQVVTSNGSSIAYADQTGSSGSYTVAAATVATDQSTSSTTYTDLTTSGPAVTLTTGSEVIVTISANVYRAASSTGAGHVSVAISGATTLAASDSNSLSVASAAAGANVASCRRFKLTGLTPGSNTFTLKYRSNLGGATFNFLNRDIVVERID